VFIFCGDTPGIPKGGYNGKIPVRNIQKFIKDIWNELNKIEESINDKRYSVTRPKKAEDIDLWTLHCIIGKFESQIRVFEKE
jgi:hypothetical protein